MTRTEDDATPMNSGLASSPRRGSSSPASTGPAGSLFEAQVAASYMLAMLAGAPPRGLPNAMIESVQVQAAPEGFPLDDVVVHARDATGSAAILEIQVKRTVSFTQSDHVFADVVGQAASACGEDSGEQGHHELAVALARSARTALGPCHDVVMWARKTTATQLFARLALRGVANEPMRAFAETFRSNLAKAGAPSDNATTWGLLRRFQILPFDFDVAGSEWEQLMLERARRLLHDEEMHLARSLWSRLVGHALALATTGGSVTTGELRQEFHEFRFAGERRYATARRAVAEAARHAYDDIDDNVGGVILSRSAHLVGLRASMDSGRFIEVRGDAGVGKSALLRHLAAQLSAEARIIFLSPGRTAPGGWPAMRAQIGFADGAADLLSDLAAGGGAVLFLDNLDRFSPGEQTTVRDLVREASTVPGLFVVASARREFGLEVPSFIPDDAVARLGRAPPLVVDELDDQDLAELRDGSPELRGLLDDRHPASAVTRNLFRLGRLARRRSPTGNPALPRTEAEMARQWWATGGDSSDDSPSMRDNRRLLRRLAIEVIDGVDPHDGSAEPSRVVNALVASQTLREPSHDVIEFRHDVLRQWAIANVLMQEPQLVGRLALDRAPSAIEARGLELAGIGSLAPGDGSMIFAALLTAVSRDGAHPAWRRSVLLAPMRSENPTAALSGAADLLAVEDAAILRELVRVVKAVEVTSASELLRSAGIEPDAAASGVDVPVLNRWLPLVEYLVQYDALPAGTLLEVVPFLATWSACTRGADPLTPAITRRMYGWLESFEAGTLFAGVAKPAAGDWHRRRSLGGEIRSAFLRFCDATPDLAVVYLERILAGPVNGPIVTSVLKDSGRLAFVTPGRLADLAMRSMVPHSEPSGRTGRRAARAFGSWDHELYPPSPRQVPFLSLLEASPGHGLRLVRRIVDRAIQDDDPDGHRDAVRPVLIFDDGPRPFDHPRSYRLSREASSGPLASALMALEQWGHLRLERNDDARDVIADVLGDGAAPAAYLLVAVDLILSHWPSTATASAPFVGCPTLLSWDLERAVVDGMSSVPVPGLETVDRGGTADPDDLAARPSRRTSLDHRLDTLAIHGPAVVREEVERRLRFDAKLLGPAEQDFTLACAPLMAVHALNRIDPANWREVHLQDGRIGWSYVSPHAEDEHFRRLQDVSASRTDDDPMLYLPISAALDTPPTEPRQLLAACLRWASGKLPGGGSSADLSQIRDLAIVGAALLVVRHGDLATLQSVGPWARKVFERALVLPDDQIHRMRSGLAYNPGAIAFAGRVTLMRSGVAEHDVEAILRQAASGNPAGARGLARIAAELASVDERLVKAVLRLALGSCVDSRPDPRSRGARRGEHSNEAIAKAVSFELSWWRNDGVEPTWLGSPFHTSSGDAEGAAASHSSFVDQQAAALWLGAASELFDVIAHPWVRDLAEAYAPWTWEANGRGGEDNEGSGKRPDEWNNVFFELLGRLGPVLAAADMDRLALGPLAELPDEAFLHALPSFLYGVHYAYFGSGGLVAAEAVRIRGTVARRLAKSSSWCRMVRERSDGVEHMVGPAVAALFFAYQGPLQPIRTYLNSAGIPRLDPFLPLLIELASEAPCLYVARLLLQLLSVHAEPRHIAGLLPVSRIWIENQAPEAVFWLEYDVGTLFCRFVRNALAEPGANIIVADTTRRELQGQVATLVHFGVAEASRLEKELAKAPASF